MSEIDRIVDQLRRAMDGDAWYGPSVSDALEGIAPEQARHRPIPEAHTVWEIALHMRSWNHEVLRRLKDGVAREPVDGDWPEVPDATEENWRFTRQSLERSLRELIAAVERFPADRLDEIVGDARDRPLGSGVSYYVLLHGIIQHNLAHAAQISLLKKSF